MTQIIASFVISLCIGYFVHKLGYRQGLEHGRIRATPDAYTMRQLIAVARQMTANFSGSLSARRRLLDFGTPDRGAELRAEAEGAHIVGRTLNWLDAIERLYLEEENTPGEPRQNAGGAPIMQMKEDR
jgi:hypothetical protein